MTIETPTNSEEIRNQNSLSEAFFADLFPEDIFQAKANFDDFVSELPILPYVNALPARIHSYARGCPSLLTKVGNANWTTQRAAKDPEGRLIVTDPAGCQDVHIEIEVKPGLFALEVLVHHETSPFLPESKLRSLVQRDVADEYRRRRKAFVEEFERQCRIPGFKMANRWVLIAKTEYNYRGKTVQQVSAWLRRMIDETADAINWTMLKLDARARFIAECDAEVTEPAGRFAFVEEGSAAMSDAEGEPIIAKVDAYASEEVPFPTVSDRRADGSEPSGTPAIVEENPAGAIQAEVVAECGGSEPSESTALAEAAQSEVNTAGNIADASAQEQVQFADQEVPFPPAA